MEEEEKEKENQIGSYFFKHVSDQISLMSWYVPSDDQVMTDEIDMILKNLGFLNLFCLCLEDWDFTVDEQMRERLRSMLTALAGRTILDRLREGIILDRLREGDVRDFRAVISELEGKIKQSKLPIEGWCANLMLSLMQCKPSTVSLDFMRFLDFRMDYFSEIFAFENNMIHFLHESLKSMIDYAGKFEDCSQSQIAQLQVFINFVDAFWKKAACLACLCWAKEANIEGNNSVFFATMMLEFIPCALDVTACYLGIVRSAGNLRSSWHPILLEETAASVVDFFFEHLSTVLKDDFLIFRDQLIYLFTFMTDDHPCENAEEDLIRSQIHALFREDAYLFLSFDEMHEDFSNQNIILRGFMIKIAIAYAKIRQSYYASSYSWIGSEAVKLDYLYYVLVQRALCAIEKHAEWAPHVRSQLQLYGMELRFLRQSLPWFAMLDDSDEEIRANLSSVIVSLRRIWGSEEEEEKGFLAARLDTIRTGQDIKEWHPLAFELEEKIELSKLEISTHLVNEFHRSPENKPSTSNKVLKFLDSILHNLNTLVRCRVAKSVSFKKQIETLEDKLAFLHNMLKLAEKCTYSNDLGEFIMLVQLFANQAARLTIMYWVKDADDKIATEINLILSRMLQDIKPSTPGVARLYFETFKAIYLQRSDPLLFGQTASIFVDFAFEDQVTLFKDDFCILRDDVIFLLTFLNDPPDGYSEELVCSQIDNSFWEDVYDLLSIDDVKRDFSKKKVFLCDFMMKIKLVNAKIRKLYCDLPDSSMYNLPKITSPWYLDFIIQNLRNLKERMTTDRNFVTFMKYKVIKIEEELVSLSPFFSYIFELQNELNDTWLQVIDLVHLTERVINLCIRSWLVFDHSIWYYMSYLSNVFEKIKDVKKMLEKIKENSMLNVCRLSHSSGVFGTHPKQDWSSKSNEVIVGFEDEAKKIIDDLTSGHKSLDIVSIVGMGGLGKTTLARKVSSSVKHHFHILAFYTVSQDHNTRMLYLGILKYIIKVDDEISRMTNDDLGHKLWKCLSRQKYLIILDDIWNTSVWAEVKESFPDNQNGSRVMFTTRFYDVANKCKIKCNPFEIPFRSKVESWELLQKMVFQNGISPPNLSNIGRRIAESCKGLPLAIAVIAGVLTRKERSQSSWSEIAEKVFSYLSDKGCMKILELSYTHLPEYLKPCLLYLGAFPEDKLFTVNQVTRLWIAEGFVPEYETKSIEDVAKEYFHDLVDRSLIIVSTRGSGGKIKKFSVHDLIHKMCQIKCHEGNFFKLRSGITASASMYDQYRISDVVHPSFSSGLSSHENASTVLVFGYLPHNSFDSSSISKLKLAQVMYVESNESASSVVNLTSVVNLRHIEYDTTFIGLPSSISNLWNIQSLILSGGGDHYLPETLWKMKSLRHVKMGSCKLQFSGGHEQLDKVVSFSNPILDSGKEVEWLLQRLPAVRKLGITLVKSLGYVETLDFIGKLESLKISGFDLSFGSKWIINFPSTLKKLTLEGLELPLTNISSIAELHCLRVLKLRYISFIRPRLEMKDVVFNHLVFFKLYSKELVKWNASSESFPCLEQLSIHCLRLKELPICFGEISTLKRIVVTYSPGVEASALRIREEQMDLGNEVEVTII